jgi:hypothetical protein
VNAKAWLYLALFRPGGETGGPPDGRPPGTGDDGDDDGGGTTAGDRPVD